MGRRFVSFGVGGTRWCLPVAEVVQIVRHENVHELPNAHAPVAGVVTLHGDIVPVVDLRERLAVGAPAEANPGAKKRRIIVVRSAGREHGILVDEVRELIDLEDEGGGTTLPPFACGRAVRGEVSLPVLDVASAVTGRPP